MKRITEIDKIIGQKIKAKRIKAGISQRKLGEALNLTFQQIQKYEYGVNRVSAGKLYKISKALNVPISYFFPQIHKITNFEELQERIKKIYPTISLEKGYINIPSKNIYIVDIQGRARIRKITDNNRDTGKIYVDEIYTSLQNIYELVKLIKKIED